MNHHIEGALERVIERNSYPCSPDQLSIMLVIRGLEELGALEVSPSKILEDEGLSIVGYRSLGSSMQSMADEAERMIDLALSHLDHEPTSL